MSAVYVEKGITLKQNQFEELKRRGNDVSELVERTDARGDRGNNGGSESIMLVSSFTSFTCFIYHTLNLYCY